MFEKRKKKKEKKKKENGVRFFLNLKKCLFFQVKKRIRWFVSQRSVSLVSVVFVTVVLHL